MTILVMGTIKLGAGEGAKAEGEEEGGKSPLNHRVSPVQWC